MKFLRRSRDLIRVELGHWLLGSLEEHRLPRRSPCVYEGVHECLNVLKKEKALIKYYQDKSEKDALTRLVSKNPSPKTNIVFKDWEPIILSKKKWRKDSQIFL